MKITLKSIELPQTPVQLKAVIVQALQVLHGQVGASIPVDILHYIIVNDLTVDCCGGAQYGRAIIRTPYRDQIKVWSSLTLCTGHTVCTVDKVSGSLQSLAVNSRTFSFPSQ